jgi:hypothetical protein
MKEDYRPQYACSPLITEIKKEWSVVKLVKAVKLTRDFAGQKGACFEKD